MFLCHTVVQVSRLGRLKFRSLAYPASACQFRMCWSTFYSFHSRLPTFYERKVKQGLKGTGKSLLRLRPPSLAAILHLTWNLRLLLVGSTAVNATWFSKLDLLSFEKTRGKKRNIYCKNSWSCHRSSCVLTYPTAKCRPSKWSNIQVSLVCSFNNLDFTLANNFFWKWRGKEPIHLKREEIREWKVRYKMTMTIPTIFLPRLHHRNLGLEKPKENLQKRLLTIPKIVFINVCGNFSC